MNPQAAPIALIAFAMAVSAHGASSLAQDAASGAAMGATELGALLLLGAAASFTPGPNTTLSSAIAANAGLARAMRFVCAVPLGWGLLFSLCAAGFGSLVLAVPVLKWGVLAVGLGYLLWLAWKLWHAHGLHATDASRLDIGFAQGVALQFVNIKAWMFALAVVAGWIAGRPDAVARFAIALPILVAFGFFSNLAYALVGALLRDWLAVGARLVVFNRAMASALVATAAWMAWSALR